MRKQISALLCVALAGSMAIGFSGCSKTTGNGSTPNGEANVQPQETEYVEDNGEPFYTCELTYLETVTRDDADNISYSVPFSYDGKYYMTYDWSNSCDCYGRHTGLATYDPEGKIVEEMSFDDIPALKKYSADEETCGGIAVNSRYGSKFLIDVTENTNGQYSTKSIFYDFITGEIKDFPYQKKDGEYCFDVIQAPDGNFYMLCIQFMDDEKTRSKLVICDFDKVIKERDLSEDLNYGYTYGIPEIKDGLITFYADIENDTCNVTYDIDKDECIVVKASTDEENDSALAISDFGTISFESYLDGKKYAFDNEGFNEVSADGSTTRLFDFDNGNLMRTYLESAHIDSLSEDQYIFTGVSYLNGISRPYMIKVQKLDNNPYAGRELLELVSLGGIDYLLDEAIVKFNDSNENCFIKIKTDYTTDISYRDLYSKYDGDTEQFNISLADQDSRLVNRLAIDIMSGDAPDIIIGTADYSQLNNGAYMADLTDFADNLPDKADLFTNVIDGMKIDGRLYSMPLSFKINGITADTKDAGDKYGFTFDEYLEFIKGPCNGMDPISHESTLKTDYMELLFRNQADLYFDGATIDVDKDGFRKSAEFVMDNVPDKTELTDDDYSAINYLADRGVGYCSAGSFYDYCTTVRAEIGSDIRFYGVPSEDGRGPSLSIDMSVSISAGCNNIEYAKEFLSFISGKEIMNKLADMGEAIPINRSACLSNATEVIEIVNSKEGAGCGTIDTSNLKKLTEDDIDRFTDTIAHSNVMPSCDPAICIIIREEILAYFAGQKSLDDIIGAVNNRAQTVLDEKN